MASNEAYKLPERVPNHGQEPAHDSVIINMVETQSRLYGVKMRISATTSAPEE